MFDVQGFEPIHEDSRNASTMLREPFRESVPEFENDIPEVRESGDEGESSMKSAVELAQQFKTSDRSIQNWYGIVAAAYSWLPEAVLKTGTGKNTRYTSLCIAKMAELKAARDAGQTANDWIASIQQQNAEQIATHQQPTAEPDEPQPTGQLAKPEILVQPSPVSALDRIRSDRYEVPNFGSNRLANAQERAKTQRFNLEDTRNRVRQAFAGLALQTAEEMTAEELERQARLEQVYQESYAETLEELQVRNAAKQDAVTDYSAFKQQVTGKGQAPNGSSVSA